MDVPPTLAEQLWSLSRSPHPDGAADALFRRAPGPAGEGAGTARPSGELIAGLTRLRREVVAVVPSCVAVSIRLSRLGIDVGITAPTSGARPVPDSAEVLSSLALPLPAAGLGCVLVLQASAPGAFVLLADDLGTLLGSDHPPPALDADLAPLAASTGSALADSLVDLSRRDRALGVLVDQGWPPEAGERELHRRASAAGLTVAAVAERLLASPSPAAKRCAD